MSKDQLIYGSIEEKEAEELWEIIYQSLHRHAQSGWNEHVGYERFRAVKKKEKILGGMGIIDMGQWFGGKIVRIGAVTSVGVAPEGRGLGVASVLVKKSLSEMYESEIPISTLLPSSTRVYRSFGYERAGVKITYETKIQDMKVEKNIVGYVNFQQARSANHIRVRDMVALNAEAAKKLLNFFYDHRTVIDTISWNGPVSDPIQLLMEEQKVEIADTRDWMLRIVDIKKALESRGYIKDINLSLTLNYEDPILPQNSGTWDINIFDGKCEVSKSNLNGIQLGPRGLAPLYTSYLNAYDIKNMGLLEGTDKDLSKASIIFSGPKPWFGDQF